MKISVTLLIIMCTLYILFGNKRIFLFASFSVLFLFAALRGDFAIDYLIYSISFYYNEERVISEVLQQRDWGYGVISYFIYGWLGTPQVLFAVVAFVTILMYYKKTMEYSVDYFLSVLLFIAVDNYIISFNLARNIMAVSICFFCMKYIYMRNFWKYAFMVLVATFVHRSAIIMLPMYWVLRIDFRKRKNSFFTLVAVALGGALLVDTLDIVLFVQDVIGMDYLSYDDFGLYSGNVGSALKTSALVGFVLLMGKKINFDDVKECVWFNSCLVAWFMQVLAASVLMVQRIGYYFSSCFILLMPLLISRSREKRKVKMGLVIALFLYDIFFQNVLEYHFFWQNTMIDVGYPR